MEEKTPSTKKNHIGRDLIIALIVVTASAASVVMPLFFLISVLVCCALLCGGRRSFSLLLLAASFAVQAFLTGSFFMASLFLMAAAIMMAPVKVFHLKFSDRPHFDGILAACAGVAVMIGAVYGMLYLALGGEPIHLVCESMQGPQKVKVGSSKVVTAKDIIIATGSVPFVPKGIEVDGMPYTIYHFSS